MDKNKTKLYEYDVYYFSYSQMYETEIVYNMIKDSGYTEFNNEYGPRFFSGIGGTYTVCFMPKSKNVTITRGGPCFQDFPSKTKFKEVTPFIDEFKVKILVDGSIDIFISKNLKYVLKSHIDFFQNNRINSIKVDEENPYFYSPKNSNCVIRKADKTLVFGGDEITIPDEVLMIGYNAFAYRNFKTLKLPENVLRIQRYAFQNCLKLENIEFNDSLIGIGDYAFSECNKLRKIVCPFGLKKIDYAAFYGCYKINEIILNDGIEWVDDIFVKNFSIKKLTIPCVIKHLDFDFVYKLEKLEEITLPKYYQGKIIFDFNNKFRESNVHYV